MTVERQSRLDVLIVEDDPDIRLSVAEILDDSGYRVASAGNGKEALDRLRTAPQKPRLILLDLMMPVMDGAAFREAQTGDASLRDIPVVVMTARPGGREIATAMAVADYVQKPFTLDRMLTVVRRYCAT